MNRMSKMFFVLALTGLALFMIGCENPISSDENGGDESGTSKDARSFDLVLESNPNTKLGTVATERITAEDDAYIDDGFFIVVSIDDGVSYPEPYDIFMEEGTGVCGTWDVYEDEQGEMPCDYDVFLEDTSALDVTSEDGNGEKAVLQAQ
ncbi:MAG: hypothetical protein U5P10_07430 [Spirochaetia bacterium]|nr:hypothetical protein [Spirochaetia bacterium]